VVSISARDHKEFLEYKKHHKNKEFLEWKKLRDKK